MEQNDFDGFDFDRDVLGDDLVVEGVVYDSAVGMADGEGGVHRRRDAEPVDFVDPAELAEVGQLRAQIADLGVKLTDAASEAMHLREERDSLKAMVDAVRDYARDRERANRTVGSLRVWSDLMMILGEHPAHLKGDS